MLCPLLALTIAAGPALPAPELFTMPDGLDVALLRTPGAPTVSVRLVVRVGAAQDPFGKDGLAHLLEHLVVSSSYAERPKETDERHRAHGIYVNAFTMPDTTEYVFDAPIGVWRTHAEQFLDIVTNPALTYSNLATELGAVDSEALHFNHQTLYRLTDLVIFPGNRGREPVLGTPTSRRSISIRDFMRVYGEYYVPGNSAAIIVGDVERADVETLLSEHVHWPPLAASELPRPPPGEINLPVDEKLPTRSAAIVFGYEVPTLDPVICDQIAALLELRMTRDIVGRRALASRVNVECLRLRGHKLILASAVSRSYESGLLPDLAAGAFADIAKRSPTRAERRVLQDRFEARLRAATLDPPRLADIIDDAFFYPDDGTRARLAQAKLSVPKLDAGAITRASAAAFVPSKRILLHLTPLD